MSENDENPRRDVCWYCGGQLIWQNDYDYADIFGFGEGIVTDLECSKCGATVQYIKRDDEDEDEEIRTD